LLGHRYSCDPSRLLWKRKSKAYQNHDMTVVAPSQWMAECARASSLFRGRRVEVIPTGVDHTFFAPKSQSKAREALSLPQGRRLILYGAANALADRRKGYAMLPEILSRVVTKGAALVVFGNEHGDQRLTEILSTQFLGRIENDDMLRDLYAAADVFLCPSVEENLPNTVLEAMACGLPVVAFKIGGMPDLVQHKRTGYLAEPFSVASFARGIDWTLEEGRSRDLSAASRARIERHFSMSSISRQYLSLYQNILKGQDSQR